VTTGQGELFTDLRTLPTVAEQQAETNAAVEAAHDAAGEQWQRAARTAVLAVAARGETFCSNDVWAWGLADPPTGNRRALGQVMRSLAKEGEIRIVGRGARSAYGHGSTTNAWWEAA
jgi:predicted transcriptional regulator